LNRNGVRSAWIENKLRERLGDKAPSRQQMLRWRNGKSIRREDMVRILWAVREVAGDRSLTIDKLFNLDPDDSDNWPPFAR
jgi:hypothetical protein